MSKTERSPVSESALVGNLAALGVEPGMTLMVHSSLSSIGWVTGGAASVVSAMLTTVGAGGTLIMPAATPFCANISDEDQSRERAGRLTEINGNLRVFDIHSTPTSMGAIAETFRTWPGTLRSNHPVESVCARGVRASALIGAHPLAYSEGPGGPFEKMYQSSAWVLLIGVGFNRCTALHYAESLCTNRRTKTYWVPVTNCKRRQWQKVENVADDNDTHFPIIGREFVAYGPLKMGLIGTAQAVLIPMRELVDFALQYFDRTL